MTLLVVTVAVALAFDFTNGFHDTANAVATSVSTRALSPRLAVLIAAIANLAGAFVDDGGREDRRQGDHRHQPGDREDGARGASLGAIVWNLITWWLGLPSSSSHALIGGLSAPRSCSRARRACEWHGVVHKVLIPALVGTDARVRGGLPAAARDLLGLPVDDAGAREPLVPARTARDRHVGRVHARCERRAEDDGRDRARALRARVDRHLLHPDLGEGRGRASRSPPAPTPAAGGSCARSASASSRWTRRPASPRRRPPGAVIYASTKYGYPLSTTHVVSGAVMGAGRDEAALGGALGRRRKHRRRLGADDPGGGARRRARSGCRSRASSDAARPRPRERRDPHAARRGRRARARRRAHGRAALPRVAVGPVAGRRQGARARGRRVVSELLLV